MKKLWKTAAVVCGFAMLGQVGRCDLGEIGAGECLVWILVWGAGLAFCLARMKKHDLKAR